MTPNDIIKKFEDKLGSDDFVSSTKLIEIGLFGSGTAVQNAIRQGRLPSLKVSSHRTLIPRQGIIDFLNKNIVIGV